MENLFIEVVVTQEIEMPRNEDTQLEKEKNEMKTPIYYFLKFTSGISWPHYSKKG
jgi:hypothetical protein